MNGRVYCCVLPTRPCRRMPTYPSDLSDREWSFVRGLFPPSSRRGRPRRWPVRHIVDAIFCVVRGGIAAVLHGACCPRTTRRGKRSTITFGSGAWMASGFVFTGRCGMRCVGKQDDIRRPLPLSSIANASKQRRPDNGGGRPSRRRLKVVRRDPASTGFAVQPRRWVARTHLRWNTSHGWGATGGWRKTTSARYGPPKR